MRHVIAVLHETTVTELDLLVKEAGLAPQFWLKISTLVLHHFEVRMEV